MDTTLGTAFTRTLGLPAGVTRRQPVDLNTIDPAYRSIYEQYNNALQTYDLSENAARNYANQSQSNLTGELSNTLKQLEQGRIAQADVARQSGLDAQNQNRVRARAVGGAPSSGFLELANKIDQSTQKGVLNTNLQASNQMATAKNQTMRDLNEIENTLNQELYRINSSRDLSMRDRDNAIETAKERARQAALAAMQLQALNGGGGGGSQTQSGGGEIQGISTTDIDTGSGGNAFGITGDFSQDVRNRFLPALASANPLKLGYVNPAQGKALRTAAATKAIGGNALKGVVNSNPFLSDLARRFGDVFNSAYGSNVAPGYYQV